MAVTRVQRPDATSSPPPLARLPFLDSDRAIVAALRARNAAGGAALYDRYHAFVRRIVLRVMGPDAEASDVVQDVFVAAIRSIDRLEEPDALKGWLARMTVYLARGEIRRRRRRSWLPLFDPQDLPEAEAPVSTPVIDEAVRATYLVLGKLPADERIAFALRHIDGMELVEVADACDVSLATIKRRLSRAQHRFLAMASRYPELTDWLVRGGA